MNEDFKLYVKSDKVYVTQYTMPHQSGGGHWCSAGYRTQSTLSGLKPEDQKAKELLDNAGTHYTLIDLSNCPFITQLKAKLAGINETPTLVINGRIIKGLEKIRHALQALGIITRNEAIC